MKTCPACRTQYSDDTLIYCLQDGTPLSSGESDMPTVVLGETETFVARGSEPHRVSVPVDNSETATWQQSQVTHVASMQAERKTSNAPIYIVVFLVGILVVLGVVVFGAVVFWRNAQRTAVSNTNSPVNIPGGLTNINYNSYPTPNVSPSALPTATRAVSTPYPTSTIDNSPPPPADESQVRSDVSQRVYGWKSGLETHDLSGYMANYAPTVDYFNHHGISSSAVRADKARAFSLYNSMRVNVSNMSVAPDPSGDAATVTFDKEWTFDGRTRSEGKTRSQLEFRRINGRWLITAERDLKLYYKR